MGRTPMVKINTEQRSNSQTIFNKALVDRYGGTGPRYTSYPTVLQFSEAYDLSDYLEWVATSNEDPIPASLSLYLHIPFCNTICYYCGCSKIVTKNREKSTGYVELLKKEIAMQAAIFDSTRQVTQIHWGGGTPTFLDDHVINDITNTIRQNFDLANDATGEYGIEIDPRTVDSTRISQLRFMGFNRVSFGVQDFDHDVQIAVNREQSEDQIFNCIAEAKKSLFHSINVDLMYGLPKQTLKSFERTLDLTIQANPDRLAVYNYAHLPQMFKPQRRINESDLPSAEEKLDLMRLTIEKLQEAGYVYIGMDHFAKPDDSLVLAQRNGTLQRNFQGYSTHGNSDLVAMGITGIGQVGDNYSQNVKSLEEYETKLNENTLPIYRGLALEPDDILRREVISQIMCNFYLDIERLENKWGIKFDLYFSKTFDTLNQMQNDGLIEFNDKRIIVTAEGRLLVRSICKLFDRYLARSDNKKQFSKLI